MFARLLILTASLASIAAAQPTTAPGSAATTLPATMPAVPAPPALPVLVDQLGDRDPAVRQQARETLMLLPASRLGELAAAVRHKKLNPNAKSLLHEVVSQIYMAGKESYTGRGRGFMGVSMQPDRSMGIEFPIDDPAIAGDGAPDGAATEEKVTPIRRGVAVQTVSLGHDSYRVLQPGDVITAVAIEGTSFLPVLNFNNLSEALVQKRAGDWVAVRLIRGGTEREVRVRLAASPPPSPQSMIAQQKAAEADEYWRKEFLPHLE